MRPTQTQFMLTSEVARLFGLTCDAVRAMERRGRLTTTRVGHVRLFSRPEVESVARQRAQERRKASLPNTTGENRPEATQAR